MNFRSKNPKLRKCGNHRQSIDIFSRDRRSLPLPGGEGRGEGERKSNPFMNLEQVQTKQEFGP